MDKLEKIFKETLEMSQKTSNSTDFIYTSVKNLDQFNEGLEYITNQIKFIYKTIDKMADENLVSFGILNESTFILTKKWEDAKEEIETRKNKVYSVSSILRKFLQNEPIIEDDIEYEITHVNCINSQIIVDGYTDDVEHTVKKYYETAKKFKIQYPYSLDDAVRIYNISIDSFNGILDECRQNLNIIPEDLPNAKQANSRPEN